jgi:hypothetical protein
MVTKPIFARIVLQPYVLVEHKSPIGTRFPPTYTEKVTTVYNYEELSITSL